jgi:hypothetical protein
MKQSRDERLATDIGPESCGAAREGGVEALTRESAGRVLSRESNPTPGRRRCRSGGRLYLTHRYREVRRGPARSETPCTYGNTSHENREVLGSPATDGAAGRVGKSKDARRR